MEAQDLISDEQAIVELMHIYRLSRGAAEAGFDAVMRSENVRCREFLPNFGRPIALEGSPARLRNGLKAIGPIAFIGALFAPDWPAGGLSRSDFLWQARRHFGQEGRLQVAGRKKVSMHEIRSALEQYKFGAAAEGKNLNMNHATAFVLERHPTAGRTRVRTEYSKVTNPGGSRGRRHKAHGIIAK
jgi:hypothetical protein